MLVLNVLVRSSDMIAFFCSFVSQAWAFSLPFWGTYDDVMGSFWNLLECNMADMKIVHRKLVMRRVPTPHTPGLYKSLSLCIVSCLALYLYWL